MRATLAGIHQLFVMGDFGLFIVTRSIRDCKIVHSGSGREELDNEWLYLYDLFSFLNVFLNPPLFCRLFLSFC